MAFLEKYKLLDTLGEGGFAKVYKVRHVTLGYVRAVRVLNSVIAQGETDKTYQRFLEECRLLLRLGNGCHPNIVHIYQPILVSQLATVEMDFVDGKTLKDYLEEKSKFVPIGDVVKLVMEIGSALAYCHEDIYRYCMDREEDELEDDPLDGSKVLVDEDKKQELINKYRVIHNDIHSGNIMRKENGSYMLLDFGLAIEGEDVVRSSKRKNGAPEFKAPEKWDDDSELSTESDVYSFGVVLYEYLTGRVPFVFDRGNSNSIEAEYLLGKAHKNQAPPSIFELRKAAYESTFPGETYKKDYPDWLETLVLKCLEKKACNRFRNGRELYDFVMGNYNCNNNSNADEFLQQIEMQHQMISELSASREQLEAQLQKADADIKMLQRHVNMLSAEKNKLATENEGLKKEHDRLMDILPDVWVVPKSE